MTRWQRRTRLVLGLLAIVFTVIVVLAIRRREPAAPVAQPPKRTDPAAVIESTGAVVVRAKGAREDFIIESDGQLVYGSGAVKLKGVRVRVDQRAGRNFVITAREAEVEQNQSNILVNGNVNLAVSDGLTAKTESASYNQDEGIVRAPGPVEFTRGRVSGSGVGMTYDKNRDVLWLLDQAVVTIARERGRDAGAAIAAGTAGFARRDKYLRFDRGVKMLRGGRVVEADAAMAYLASDEEHLDSLELRGNSRIVASASGVGGLQAMTSRDMNLKYRQDGETLEHAHLVGDAVIQLAGSTKARGRRIAADMLEIVLAPDGSTVMSLVGRDRVQLDIPAEEATSARRIKAATLEGSGEPGRGLTGAKFTGNVEYRELSKPPASERAGQAQQLGLSFKPGMSAIEEARFVGAVRFEEGALHAGGNEARYFLGRGVLVLAGSDGSPGSTGPSVANQQIDVRAPRIELTLEGPKLNATGGVRSVMQPSRPSSAEGARPGSSSRTPGVLKQDQPIYVTAETLVYDGNTMEAVYTGGGRLWQADSTILAETISLDNRRGNLAASGSVRSSLTFEDTNETTKAKEKVTSVATADELRYDEAARRATYTTRAHASGPQGDLTADRIELYLKPSDNELERAEAYTAVTVRLQTRTSTGDRLTYFSRDERYLMSGAPVKIVEECRETIGKTLTFFKGVDRIVVDGHEESRTQTKGGGKCP